MTDTVLLTGISGFLGSHVALQLLQAGYNVRGSLRNLNRADEVRQTLSAHGADVKNLEFVTLDLLNDAGWDDAMKGVKYLQHTASPFVTSMPEDEMDLIRPAVDGTARAINAALASKVEHIVLTSSMASIFYGHPKTRTKPFTEQDWTDPKKGTNAYSRSKTLAERKAWQLVDDAGRHDDLSVINPSFILGPLLNKDPGTSGALIIRFLTGSLPAAPKLNLHCIDVRDVAAMHVLAMTAPGAKGKRHVIAGASLSMLEMAQILGARFPAYSGKLPKFELPDWAIRLYAIFDSDARSSLSELGYSKAVDASHVRVILGRDFITAQDTLVAMAQTVIDQDLI